MNIQKLHNLADSFEDTPRLPSMFIGHGNPMNAILDNTFSRAWKHIGAQLPRPKAILCVSAHWITQGSTRLTAMEKPRTIHDFGGFPKELYEQKYAASGAPEFAGLTQHIVKVPPLALDYQWGLDHGTWSVLLPMYPLAEIPVYQLSIDYNQPPQFHFELGAQLKELREKGVLIIGSGNIVHNLNAARNDAQAYDWAIEFDRTIETWLQEKDHKAIVNFQNLGSLATRAHPTYDHYLPLLYVIGVRDDRDSLEFFNTEIDLSSVSMRSLIFR
jgi:4,5-DOPA dioxygenase extradiol